MEVTATCALCGQPPGNAKWKAGDSWCYGCKNFVCFDCHIKGPGVIPSGPHTLELHKKKGAQRQDFHMLSRPTVVNQGPLTLDLIRKAVNVIEQQKGLDEVPIIVSGGSSKTFTPAPAGLHNGVLVDVEDLGMRPNKFYDPKDPKSKQEIHKIRLIWEIAAVDPETGQRFTVAQTYTASIHEKSSLGKLLVAWRGKPFTQAEIDAFDLEKLIGVPCQITVIHNAGNEGQIYANVESVAKFTPELKVDDQVIKRTAIKPSPSYIRVKDRAPKESPAAAGVDPEMPF